MEQYIEFKGVSKAFPGVQALKDVSFRVDGGKVIALLGENGAGKSTLLKILSGNLIPDEGNIVICGTEKCYTTPHEAIKDGISVIYQERQLVPLLSVAENIFIEDLPRTRFGHVKKKELKRKTQQIIDEFALPIEPGSIVGSLSVAYQQMVEIMKAYRRNSDIICFDEPTASLTDTEINILFRIINELKNKGKGIIYVSHRLAEIFRIADDIVILKDGSLVKTLKTSEATEQQLISLMVGRDIGDTYANLKRNDTVGEVVLEVKNLRNRAVRDVSFQLHRGEVLGFAGLVGAGRTEVMRAIFGADPIESGEIYLRGKRVRFKTPTEAIENGIALCPEDRKEQGLVLPRSIRDNISIPVLLKVRRNLFLDRKKENSLAVEGIRAYDIKTPSAEKITLELSGGNQQKVILARWTSALLDTDVLILDEPTKGIDVGTKAEIYQMVCDLARNGKGVVFISSELTEVLNLSDRIIVMHNGKITGEVTRQEATEESVLSLAMI